MSDIGFHDLLDRYLSNSLSSDELKVLLDYIRQEKNRVQLEEAIARALAARRFERPVDSALGDRIFQQIMQKAAENESRPPASGPMPELQPSRKILPLRRVAAAAVIFIMLGGGIYFWLSRIHKPAQAALVSERLKDDVEPGGNKAVLTLSNGSTIILDSVHPGQIAAQASVNIVKSDSGKLVYTVLKEKTAPLLYNTLTTPRGGQYQLVLPDGTKVWLNAASSIRYPVIFVGNERRVEITGEAYFEVFKNPLKPFKISINGKAEVAVLGTHFNINAYEDEIAIKTTLLEGSVKLTARENSGNRGEGGRQEIVLKPGQQAQLLQAGANTSRREQIKVINNADIEEVMAWKNGSFRFNQADLVTVLRQLARWYDITVKYEGAIPVGHFKGELPRDLTLSQVISILGEMEVKFKIEGKNLIVTP